MRKALQAPKLRGESSSEAPFAGPGPSSKSLSQNPKGEAEKASSMHYNSNPIYSPDDSLAKAATKLASIKASADLRGAPAPATKQQPDAPSHNHQQANQEQKKKPRGSSPGYRPDLEGVRAAAATGGAPNTGPAARTKRQRRKSVFAPADRYGDWFTGDDTELDQQLEQYNDDDEEAAAAGVGPRPQQRGGAEATRGRERVAPPSPPPAARQQNNNENNGKPVGRSQRRKSIHPAAAQAQAATAAQTPPPQREERSPVVVPAAAAPGPDVAQKVRAIANDLCSKLDGLIEETPAEQRRLAARDGRSLREKLLESWEGRVSIK
jgi:hypothetical protein